MRYRRTTIALTLAASATLAACSAEDDPLADLDRLRADAAELTDDARASAEDLRDRVDAAGLDDDVRAAAESAAERAEDAVAQARAALADADADEQARARAREALERARADLSAAADRAGGAVAAGLRSLAEQLDRLADQLAAG